MAQLDRGALDPSLPMPHTDSVLAPLRHGLSEYLAKRPRPSTPEAAENSKKKIEHPGPGFGLNTDLSPQNTPELLRLTLLDRTHGGVRSRVADPYLSNRKRENARRIAGLLLGAGHTVHQRFNVVDAIKEQDQLRSEETFQASRASRQRAEQVRLTLGTKYRWLERLVGEDAEQGDAGSAKETGAFSDTSADPEAQDSNGLHIPQGSAPGYNPLQVLRDKMVWVSLHEHVPPIPWRDIPLPCNAFSSRYSTSLQRKFLWGVELDECVYDFGWQKRNPHLMLGPDGGLKYPAMGDDESHLAIDNSRLHDRLWEATGSNDKHRARSPAAKLGHRFKSKARRLYGTAWSSLNSDDDHLAVESAFGHSSASGHLLSHSAQDLLATKSTDSLKNFFHRKPNSNAALSHLRLNSSGDDQEPRPPIIRVADELGNEKSLEDFHHETDIEEKTVSRNVSQIFAPSVEPEPRPETSPPTETQSSQDHLEKQPSNTDLLWRLSSLEISLSNHVAVNRNFLGNVVPRLTEITLSKLDRLIHHDINSLIRDVVHVNDEQIPRNEQLYSGLIGESKSLLHMANDKYAVQIDNLLSATDRSIGELNTSLLMDFKRISDDLDSILKLYLRGHVLPALTLEETYKFTEAGSYEIFYSLLENFIVISLRSVWVVVTIFKFSFSVLRFLFGVLTWWC